MDIDREVLGRISAAKAFDKTLRTNDFQIRAGENGSVLINLKTGKAQLIYDDDSELHDFEDLGLTDENAERRSSSDKTNATSELKKSPS